jgi:hypothetical protein
MVFGILSVVFGILSFVLVIIDHFEVQVICAILAVGISSYAIFKQRSKLGMVGLFIGALFLVTMGLLWLLWPK